MSKIGKRQRLGELINYRGSRAERLVYSVLCELLREKIILEIQDCTDNSVKSNEGQPDFKITKNDRSILPIEVKSSLVGVEKYQQKHPDTPVIAVYPYWEISPKFRRFNGEEAKRDIKDTILSLLHIKTGGETC